MFVEVSNVKFVLHQPAIVAAPPMCPLHVWRGEWKQRRVFVLEIMSHTHGSTITNCCWAIGISSPSQDIEDLGWNRLGLRPSEMMEVMEDREVWRLNLELLPPQPSRKLLSLQRINLDCFH